jgi:hypothetical protein
VELSRGSSIARSLTKSRAAPAPRKIRTHSSLKHPDVICTVGTAGDTGAVHAATGILAMPASLLRSRKSYTRGRI